MNTIQGELTAHEVWGCIKIQCTDMYLQKTDRIVGYQRSQISEQ